MEEGQSDHFSADLLLRVKIFLRDLLEFESDDGARCRLEQPTAEFYFSTDYFSPKEADMLLLSRRKHQQPGGGGDLQQQQGSGTLREALQEWLLPKMERGDYHVCTSHDLAPIIQGWFDVRKGFQDNPRFKKELKVFVKTWQKQQKQKQKQQQRKGVP